MFRKKIGNSKKLAILIGNQVFALMFIMVFMFAAVFGSRHGSWKDLLNRKTYEQSDYFQSQSRNQVTRAIRAATRSTRFEKNGAYDPERMVNIQSYAEENRIDGTQDSTQLCYRLSDLLKWAKEGWSYSVLEIDREGNLTYNSENISSAYNIESSEVVYMIQEDGSQNVVNSEKQAQFFQDLQEYFLSSENEWEAFYNYYLNISSSPEDEAYYTYGKEILNEVFAPVNYSSIVEYARVNQVSLDEVYADLDLVLNNIVSDVLAYRENISLFSTENTNLRFFLLDLKNNRIYTNTSEKITGTAQEKQIYIEKLVKKYGSYLIYDSVDLSVDQKDISLMVTDLYGYAENYGLSCSEEYVMAVGIDTNYPADDVLKAEYDNYVKFQPWAWLAVVVGIISLVGYLVTFLLLTLSAGEVPDRDEPVLIWFDDWKLEVAGIVLGIAAFLPMLIEYRYLSSLLMAGILFMVGLYENALLLIGWTSVVRRIKTRTFWSNSILYMIWEFCKGVFRNRKKTTRMIIGCVLYMAVLSLFLEMGDLGKVLIFFSSLVLLGCLIRYAVWDQELQEGIGRITQGDLEYQFDTEKFSGFRKEIAEELNNIQQVMSQAVSENMKNERLKTELITNVSHDLKTPLTSIVNYVGLLKQENIENERVKGYIQILEQKSDRLRYLTEDLLEASRISSGNIELELVNIHLQELLYQTSGEFVEKFSKNNLKLIETMPKEPIYIQADGRRLWRVIENLYNNVAKYAMPNTRVYVELRDLGSQVMIIIKNISEQALNIDAKDLTERFIRGDVARSSEGSGLGLSIARNLTELQGGKFDIYLDGDLFRVTLKFPKIEIPEEESIEISEGALEKNPERD